MAKGPALRHLETIERAVKRTEDARCWSRVYLMESL